MPAATGTKSDESLKALQVSHLRQLTDIALEIRLKIVR